MYMLPGDLETGQMIKLRALKMFEAIPAMPWPSMTAPMYLNGRPPAREKTEAWQTPVTIPNKNRTRKVVQKPSPPPKCAKIGIVMSTTALSINVITILDVKEYLPP